MGVVVGETWGVLIGRRPWKLPSSVDSEDSRGRGAVPVLEVLGDLPSGDQPRDFQPCDARGQPLCAKTKSEGNHGAKYPGETAPSNIT
jgi:hypothetical protein